MKMRLLLWELASPEHVLGHLVVLVRRHFLALPHSGRCHLSQPSERSVHWSQPPRSPVFPQRLCWVLLAGDLLQRRVLLKATCLTLLVLYVDIESLFFQIYFY